MSKLKALFKTGEPVTGEQYMEAMIADVQESRASSMDERHAQTRKAKYNIEKLDYDTRHTMPESLDLPPVTPSKYEVERLNYLKEKFKLKGLDFAAWCHDGGWRKVDVSHDRRDESKLHRAYATIKGKKVALDWSFIP